MSQPLHADDSELRQGAAVLSGPYYEDMSETTRRFQFRTTDPLTNDPRSEMDGIVVKVVRQRVDLASDILEGLTNLTFGDAGNVKHLSDLLDRTEELNSENADGWTAGPRS